MIQGKIWGINFTIVNNSSFISEQKSKNIFTIEKLINIIKLKFWLTNLGLMCHMNNSFQIFLYIKILINEIISIIIFWNIKSQTVL